MTDIKKLIRELRRVKAQYDLMSISTIIEDAPIDELQKFAHENNLKVNNESVYWLHALYSPECGIDISIFSKKVSHVEIGNEDHDAYDQIAQG